MKIYECIDVTDTLQVVLNYIFYLYQENKLLNIQMCLYFICTARLLA